LNRRLAECGLLARAPGRATDRAARAARDAALRLLPPRAAQGLFRRLSGSAARLESTARFGGLAWARTVAFSEETNTQPGVWINLRGREAEGSVRPGDYERVRQEVIDALLDWKLPGSGDPVVARACRREEVYEGPFVERAPDVVLELALEDGYAHSIVPTRFAKHAGAVHTLADEELGGGRGRGMNGTHRPAGVWLTVGCEPSLRAAPRGIEGVAPLVLAALGVEPDESPRREAPPAPYDAAQEARVAARLRALGYLE
jgi:hypothetical protein